MILSEQEKKEWLQLAFSENVGPITFHSLLGFFGSAKEAMAHKYFDLVREDIEREEATKERQKEAGKTEMVTTIPPKRRKLEGDK